MNALFACAAVLPLLTGPADGLLAIRRVGQPNATASACVVDPNGATCTKSDGTVETIPLDEIISLEFSARVAAAVPEGEPATVLLYDGSRISGAIAGGGQDALRLSLRPGSSFDLPVDAISAIFLGGRADELDRARFERSDKEDAIFKRPELGGDYTTGTLQSFSASGLEFEYTLGKGTFAWKELEAVILARQIDLPPAKAPIVHADLVPDGRLSGTLVSFGPGGLELKPQGFKEPLALPAEAVRSLRFDGPRHAWLSDLAPSRVEQTPYLGSGDQFLFPYRVDRSVTGKPLSVGGRVFAKGFGCHSRTRLEWKLEAGAKSFSAFVGVSDEVLTLADRGAIQFAVVVDGKEAWRSATLRAGDPAVAVGPIAVEGAQTIALITDFAEGEDVADRGVWGDPLLLR